MGIWSGIISIFKSVGSITKFIPWMVNLFSNSEQEDLDDIRHDNEKQKDKIKKGGRPKW